LQAEEEMMPAMTEEELQKRRDVLARNHALLFYQEQKAKRLKKIKSKVYRRHVKKQSAKLKATMGVIELDDPDAIHVCCSSCDECLDAFFF
jgi:U3 small nucleolar RNA-associated protein 14